MTLFKLSILTPEKVVFEDEVYSVNAPGAEGYLEVLAHHAPLATLLQAGQLVITDREKQKSVFKVNGGFLEVSRNQATILVDRLEKS